MVIPATRRKACAVSQRCRTKPPRSQSGTIDKRFRKRRRLKALAVAARQRVQKLRTILDRDDPIADERRNRDTYWRAVQQQSDRAKAVAA